MAARYELAGARGGQGTTTVATALAVLAGGHASAALAAHDPDAVRAIAGLSHDPDPTGPTAITDRVALTGLSDGTGDAEVTVADLGRIDDAANDSPGVGDGPETTRWLVVRGPCYLSLRSAIMSRWRPHGVILVAERARALTAADVADVLGVPVVATVPVEPSVARLIDAGLLVAHLHRALPFKALARLVTEGLHPAYREAAEATP